SCRSCEATSAKHCSSSLERPNSSMAASSWAVRSQTRCSSFGVQPADFVCDPLALGDVLGKDDDAAHLSAAVPGEDFPAEPLDGAIGMLEAVLVAPDDVAAQAPLMGLLPALGDFGKDIVVRLANEVLTLAAVVGRPAVADDEVAHVAVELGDAGG